MQSHTEQPTHHSTKCTKKQDHTLMTPEWISQNTTESREVWDGSSFRLIRYPNLTLEERRERILNLAYDDMLTHWAYQL